MKKSTPSHPKTLALTGSGFKGQMLLRWLERDRRFPRVLYLNYQRPRFSLQKIKFYQVDLTGPMVDIQLAEIFKKEKVDTVVHTAFPITPPHDLAWAHELISVGTMYLCNAAAATRVRKMILTSSSDVYGAFPDNPNYLTEKHSPRGGRKSIFLKDRIDAENQFLHYAEKNPKSIVTLLRPATILGPTIQSYKTRYLAQRLIPVVLGYDPLVQFIHEEDLLQGFKLAIEEDHPGIFNLASRGVIPLYKAIRLMGKTPLPLSLLGLKSLVQALWFMNISPAPATHLEFLKYLCVVAIDKAERELGFKPRYSSRETLLEFAKVDHLRQLDFYEKSG